MKKAQITLLILLVAAAALTVGCGSSSVPTFKQLAFLSNRTVTPATPLFVMNLDGSGVAPVAMTTTNLYSPSNAASLQAIVFASNGNVWTSNAAGTTQTQLTTYDDKAQGAFDARISPNGKKIVYGMWDNSTETDSYWIMNADGTGAVNLNATLPTGMTGCFNGSFSADSSQVVYVCYGPSNTYGLYTAKADGTGSVTTVYTQTGFIDTPAFSPNGKQIYFVQFNGPAAQRVHSFHRVHSAPRPYATGLSTSGIASVNLDGSNPTVVVSGTNSIYDVEVLNSTLYYTVYDSSVSTDQIYKANLDGTGSVKVSDGSAEDWLGLSED